MGRTSAPPQNFGSSQTSSPTQPTPLQRLYDRNSFATDRTAPVPVNPVLSPERTHQLRYSPPPSQRAQMMAQMVSPMIARLRSRAGGGGGGREAMMAAMLRNRGGGMR